MVPSRAIHCQEDEVVDVLKGHVDVFTNLQFLQLALGLRLRFQSPKSQGSNSRTFGLLAISSMSESVKYEG